MRVVRLLAGAALWLLGVAGVAGAGCFAVDSAGPRVGGPESALDVDPAGGAGPASSAWSSLPAADVPPRATTAPVTARPSPTVSRAASRASRPAGRSSTRSATESWTGPSAAPSTSAPPAPGQSVPAPSPAVTRPPSPSPSPSAGTGTFTSEAGTLTVACSGSTPAVVSLDLAPGWSSSAELDGDELDLEFSSDSGQVLHVRAICRDGVPVVTAA